MPARWWNTFTAESPGAAISTGDTDRAVATQAILHYVQQYSPELIARKLSYLPEDCPLLRHAPLRAAQ